jgi:glycosyltransferase 2 family protein
MRKLQTEKRGGNPVLLALRICIAVGALAWVFRNQEWSELRQVFRGMNPVVFSVCLLVFAGTQAVLATRWWWLLRALSIRLRLGTAVRLHFLGLFYNNLMPSSIGGDFVRAWYAAKHTEKRIVAALSVFIDRGIGLFGLVLMAGLSFLFLMQDHDLGSMAAPESAIQGQAHLYGEVGLYVLVIGAAILCLLLGWGKTRLTLIDFSVRVLAQARRTAQKASEAVRLCCKSPRTVVGTLILTVLLQTCAILAFWLLGRDLNIEAGIKHYFMIFPAMWVVGALPISIAGFGILEGGITILFVRLAGTSPEQAACLALCQRFIWILCSLPGALIHLTGGHLPKTFSFDENPDGR